jgi:hypothetical protein
VKTGSIVIPREVRNEMGRNGPPAHSTGWNLGTCLGQFQVRKGVQDPDPQPKTSHRPSLQVSTTTLLPSAEASTLTSDLMMSCGLFHRSGGSAGMATIRVKLGHWLSAPELRR